MLVASLSIFGGLVLLVVGAEGIVRGAASGARRLGISPLIIGLTVVAYGTSAPELAVSLQAAMGGNPDIALGNVVGSNIFNVLGILGVTACIHPVDATGLTWWDGGVLFGFTLITLPLFWTDYTFSRLEGGILLVGYGAYVGTLVTLAV